ncbi:hypothetical protein [Jingyaoa shaoxingensis]|uniref:Lipoprotein n=1 Tax=Jingyaoa shaoxingensis TaxID=2763671 RepID=A0ABR7NDD9_9FIRM|nr:hypothetical protein [Jingyaoa shaoxingensis]MBC8574429.1 hypothetical protein [Jingyaoa shaoxingensis]
MGDRRSRGKRSRVKARKPIFKKWWFWGFIIIIIGVAYGSTGKDDNDNKETEINSTTEAQTNIPQTESEAEDSLSFNVMKVPNDVTGNWRVATMAENVEAQNIALDYYKKYFGNDDEIHAIVNFNYKTTTKISVMGDLLDVSVYEYVDKEEHDANLLFSGMLLKEYHVNKETGAIEEIQ